MANDHFGASTTSTNSAQVAGQPVLNAPDAEIAALARSLRNDPDLIFQFVRNSVDTSFTFGVSKGALGALIDRAGTPFDQAQLLVETLRAAGITASYRYGTISPTPEQFQTWTGVSGAVAACQLLANGGIPAIVNGSSSASCASYSGQPLNSVTLSHVWVAANLPGGTFLFDPSFKAYAPVAGVSDLRAAAGINPAHALTAAAPAQTGAQSGVGYIRNLAYEGLASELQARANQLQTYIDANLPAGALEDLIGGRRIIPDETQQRQASLPYAAPVQTWTGDIPDQYRASLRVQITKVHGTGSYPPEIINHLFYVDDIYGRKLIFDTNFDNNRDFGGTQFIGRLRLVNELGEGPTIQQFSSLDPPTASLGTITLTVDMPYAAPAADGGEPGKYMDLVSTKDVRFAVPFTILHGWGNSRGLPAKWGARPDEYLPIPPALGCDTCLNILSRGSKGDGRREQLAASWLAQASRAAGIHAQIARAEFQHHYSVGVVAADTTVLARDTDPNPSISRLVYEVADSFDRIDVDTGFSLSERDDNVAGRRAATHAIAATLSALEGSVLMQVADLPDISSTATRFAWANRPPASEDFGNDQPRRFYAFTPADGAQAFDLVRVESMSSTSDPGVHPGHGEPTIGSNEVLSRRTALADTISSYAGAGFSVTASEDAFLGPGQRAGAYKPYGGQTGIPSVFTHLPSFQRGGALVATRYEGAEPVEIAHVTVGPTTNAKGGGGGAQVYHAAQYDPNASADLLRASFVDRSSAAGVDLRSGSVSYTSPAALSVGQGEFPYRLSASVSWSGAPTFLADRPDGSASGLWTNSWNNSLSISSSALEAMGETDLRAAAGTIATFLVMQEIYAVAPSTRREVAGVLTAAWWLQHLSGNVVTASLGADTRQFLRRANGDWFLPGPGGYATLHQTGARTVVAERPSCTDPDAVVTYVPTRGWSYAGMQFRVTGAQGDEQTFAHWQEDVTPLGGPESCTRERGFRLTTWSFPQGVNVNLTYASSSPGAEPEGLVEVSNNLGRRLTFTDSGRAGFTNGLAGADRREVIITATAHTDPAGEVTRFAFAPANHRQVLTEIYAANDANLPALRYRYDPWGRVLEADDAAAVRGERGPHRFYIAAGYVGSRTEPTLTVAGGVYPDGPSYRVFYDHRGRPVRYVDELGRTTTAAYDGRGRPVSYTYPEGNQQLVEYDGRNNITSLRAIADADRPCAIQPLTAARLPNGVQTLAPCADRVIEAEWNLTWNKPSRIRDTGPDGQPRETTFSYYASGNGAGLLYRAVRPDPGGGSATPTYEFEYNQYGLLTRSVDPTAVVETREYDAFNYLDRIVQGAWSSAQVVRNFANDALGQVSVEYVGDDPARGIGREYDAMGRVTRETRPHGTETRTSYDALGRPFEVRRRLTVGGVETWAVTRTGYTPTGQVWWVQDPAGDTTISEYDAMDRRVRVTDPEGVTTRYDFDAAGQLVVETRGITPSTPAGEVYARFGYTLNGQQAWVKDGRRPTGSITAANNTATFEYDGHNRLRRTTWPDGGGPEYSYEQLAYDPAGNVHSRRTRENLIIYSRYDRLDRRDFEGEYWADGVTEAVAQQAWRAKPSTFTYDLAGRMKTASTSEIGRTWTYDTAGRPIGHSRSIHAAGTFAYTYQSGVGSLETISYGTTGRTATHTYDLQGRLTNVVLNTGGAAAITYDELGRRTSVGFGDGSSQAYSWEIDDDLVQIAHVFPNRTSDNVTFDYAYDRIGRLVGQSISNMDYVWQPPCTASSCTDTYAAATAINTYPTVTGPSFSDGGLNFVYSNLGGLPRTGAIHADGVNFRYRYDAHGNLVRVHTWSGNAVQNQYPRDALGERYWESNVPAGADHEAFRPYSDGLRPEVAVELRYTKAAGATSWSGAGTHVYVLGPNPDERLIWVDTAGTVRYPHTDRRGSTIAISQAGQAVERFHYGEFGQSGPTITGYPYRYTGQRLDAWTGLYNYKAREYAPSIGRFLQPDPLGFVDGPNVYAYVENDPLNGIDPTGAARVCATATGSNIPSCVDVDADLTRNQVQTLSSHFRDFITRNAGADLGDAGKPVHHGSASEQDKAFTAAVSQFVGYATQQAGGAAAAAWSQIHHIDADSPAWSFCRPSCQEPAPAAIGPIRYADGQTRMVLWITGRTPGGIGRNPYSSASNLARLMIHERNHLSMPNAHHQEIDRMARIQYRRYGLAGGGCINGYNFYGCER